MMKFILIVEHEQVNVCDKFGVIQSSDAPITVFDDQ